ncbi:hypothetical protein C8R45DRAFT_1076164 [Mycena sanguinolenta]|nr:hypothetical protein C8R45DRAFT_1076164 [Mycena sanguinolenta]
MPRQPTITEIQLENLAACLTPAVAILNELNDAFAPPFVQPISKSIASLINLVQNVKQNKKECAQLLENTHQVLYAIIELHIRSDAPGSLSPVMMDHVEKFMKTLHKIYAYIEAQQDSNKIRQLFRNMEMNSLVKDCHTELDEAKKIFEVNTAAAMFKNIAEMKKEVETKHKELLELISTISETNTTSDDSSVHLGANELKNSSNSFSLLPSKPKIFYGRETELNDIMKILLDQPAPRIAILGGGGMGKTSLARAALHHPDTLTRFEQRFFISAEPATNSIELAALIGLHIGLNPGKNLTEAVVQYFSKKPQPCLLILDNLETVWEPLQSRGTLEEFLSLLVDVKHLGLIITMRGTERPAKVQWTRPFLLPLQPLSDNAAQQIFIDITDGSYSIEDFSQLLGFTDNMPLAVDLLAHLVDYEGLESVQTQWETEKTSMLSVGYDRKSNLNASIDLSLSSPRITSDSKDLLSLLSILPDGLSDAELIQSKFPISNILSCKAILLATSLAYQSSNKRLLVLMPVREHIQQALPLSPSLLHCLQKHFYAVLKLHMKCKGEQRHPVISQITLNLANLQEVLQRGLYTSDPNLLDTIYCSIYLNSFYRTTSWGVAPVMEHIQDILPGISDHRLQIHFIKEVLMSFEIYNFELQTENLIIQGLSHLEHIEDPLLESKFYLAASIIEHSKSDSSQAQQFANKALQLAKLSGDSSQQCDVLLCIARFSLLSGNYSAAERYAREAQELSELSMNLYSSAIALSLQAECSRQLGNYHKSMAQNSKAKAFLEICGMSEGGAGHHITLNQAEIHLLRSEYTQAQRIFSNIAGITSPVKKSQDYATACLNIAYVDIQIGGTAENIWKNLNIASEIYKSHASNVGTITCKAHEACMNLTEHAFDLAQIKFQKSLHFNAELTSLSLERLADIKAWPACEEQARWPVIYLSFAHKVQEKLALHKALLFLGDVFMVNEDEDTAFALYTVALEGFTHMDVHQSRAQCMLRLGDLAQKHGNTAAAIAHWKGARPLFERSSQAKNITEIDSRLATVEKAHKEALIALVNLKAPDQQLNEVVTFQEQPEKVAPVWS